MDDTENAAELQFGSEFVGEVQFINNDEAFFLLSKKAMDTAAPTEYVQSTLALTDYSIIDYFITNLKGLSANIPILRKSSHDERHGESDRSCQ